MRKGKVLKKVGALLFAAVLALSPLSSASAQDPWPTTGTGDITVHKLLRDSQPTEGGNGEELSAAEEAALGTPAEGVEFSLYPVPSAFDMTITTTVAEALKAATDAGVTPYTGTTDADGIIKWASIPVGYYVLVETKGITGYTMSPDAIIALPYGLDDKAWNFDVHVYPKNVNEKPLIKEIEEDKPYNVGDTVTWEFKAQVDYAKLYTDGGTGGTPAYGSYKITDTLDTRLDYLSTTSVKGTGGKDVTLVAGTDYNVTSTAGVVVWTLTEAGIDKLVENSITSLLIKFETEVNETALGSGTEEIPNGGKLEWDNYEGTTETPYEIDEDDKPAAKLYNLEIIKTNKDGTKYLNGAQFKIADSYDNAVAGVYIQDSDDNDLVVTTATHDSIDGWAQFNGLGGSATADTKYYLVEVVAPTDSDTGEEYIRPTIPFEVVIKENTASNSITIANYLPGDDKPDIWNLPLTGGMGTVIFYVIGAVVMLGSVVVFIRSKRKNIAR